MKIIDVKQGSKEWLAIRAKCFTASEAASMMGKSKHMTRTELLELKKTGIQAEVSPHLQKIFDNGHAAEALARPIVEKLSGEEFYPVTGILEVDGLSVLASFDGLTMMEDTVFEHKLWNKELVESVRNDNISSHYYWQLEQQLLVSGAENALFVVSDGTEENIVFLEYYPVTGRKEELIAGWKQFAIDLENFTVEAPEVKHETTELMALPSLSIVINGTVSKSNLGVYESTALSVINNINTELLIDAEFAQAEIDIKFCSNAEKELISVKKQALASTSEIDMLFKTIDYLSEALRTKRLTLTKLVKTQKEKIKKDIIAEASMAIGHHIIDITSTLSGLKIPVIDTDFYGSVKGKRNIASMRDAINTELSKAKIEANKLADIIRINLKIVEVLHEHKFLFNDLQEICSKDSVSFAAIVESRINKYHEEEEIKAEAMREKIRKEEEAKAELEANRKLEEERETLRAEAQKRADEAEAEIAKTKKANLEKQLQEERDREKIRIEEKQKNDPVEKQKLEEEQKHQDLLDEHEQRTEHELCCSSEFLPNSSPSYTPLPVLKQARLSHTDTFNEKEPEETITIPLNEYNLLVSNSNLLQALFMAGVDGTDLFKDAIHILEKDILED